MQWPHERSFRFRRHLGAAVIVASVALHLAWGGTGGPSPLVAPLIAVGCALVGYWSVWSSLFALVQIFGSRSPVKVRAICLGAFYVWAFMSVNDLAYGAATHSTLWLVYLVKVPMFLGGAAAAQSVRTQLEDLPLYRLR